MDLGRYRDFVDGNDEEPVSHDTFKKFHKSKFSWPAFIVMPFYYVYRKLYVEFVVLWLVRIMINLIVLTSVAYLHAPAVIEVVSSVVWWVGMGFLFYPLYRWKFKRLEHKSDEELKAAGGTNKHAVTALLLVFLIIAMIAGFVAHMS